MTLNCKGNLISLKTPKIMGILNITPDSFYDGGQHGSMDQILKRVENMIEEGATFIDVGGYSSRPGAAHISEQEELDRVLPVISGLISAFPDLLISVDTFRSLVAKACLEKGAALINDISGGSLDEEMMGTIAKFNAPFILMHMKGTPQNMIKHTQYEDITLEVLEYFSQKIAEAHVLGINDLIIDPGFGFSKTLQQNYELLNKMELLQGTEKPILVGLSRKSMIYKTLGGTAKEALNGTTALHMTALQKGASILRVHDVREAYECVQLYQSLKQTT